MICPVLFRAKRGGGMRRTDLLQEIRKMRFEEAYGGWREENALGVGSKLTPGDVWRFAMVVVG